MLSTKFSVTINGTTFAPGDTTPAGLVIRKSGFPYGAKLSPTTPRPTRRYKNVSKLSQLMALIDEVVV